MIQIGKHQTFGHKTRLPSISIGEAFKVEIYSKVYHEVLTPLLDKFYSLNDKTQEQIKKEHRQ